MKQQRRYHSYLLRLWQENAGESPGSGAPIWRASLQSPQSDERMGFGSLADLFVFLEKETEMRSLDLECSDEEGRR